MSRHASDKNPNFARVVKAGEYWRDRCLIEDGSLFTDKRLWSRENIDNDFGRRFVDFIVPSDDPKYKTGSVEQWKTFLEETNSPPETYQLMAEFLWVCHRPDSHMRPATKKNKILSIWKESGEESFTGHLPEPENLQHGNLIGIAKPGQGVATRFWFELLVFAFFVREIKMLDIDERTRILIENDGKEFSQMWDAWPRKWYDQWPQQWSDYFAGSARKLKLENSPIRHIVMYLLFPDYFECIYSGNDKLKIVKAFSGEDMSRKTWTDIDRAIYEIRQNLEKEHDSVHFYKEPIKHMWKNNGTAPVVPPPQPVNPRSTDMLNQIFYGPPGTGKTYHTVNAAVKIINPNFLSADKNRPDINKEFDRLKKSGQVEFVTFHQSFGYEEFVEGIRPTMDGGEGDVSYEIKDGVLKRMCEKAASVKPLLPFEDAIERLKEECSENRVVMKTVSYKKEHEVWHIEGNDSFMTKPMEGTSPDPNPVTVSVKRIKRHYDDPERKGETRPKMIFNYLKENYGLDETQRIDEKQNYVLIIDEINRGNVSRIFGELITLIEESKRKGNKEETTVTLPYSDEEFGIPNNLYIIGTMNTADRSIALLDTALRRRFRFIEMMPDYAELQKIEIGGVNIGAMLKAMNDRIEALYDRDHQIGHSYFLRLQEAPNMDTLKDIFLHEVLPLLQEYFYEDWEKIDLILNRNGFIEKKNYPKMPNSDSADRERKLWQIADEKAFLNESNYLKIYSGTTAADDEEHDHDS